jgi:hypothetical protein
MPEYTEPPFRLHVCYVSVTNCSLDGQTLGLLSDSEVPDGLGKRGGW